MDGKLFEYVRPVCTRKIHFYRVATFLLFLGFLVISVTPTLYAQQQLTGDMVVHDPVMTKHDGTYYIFHTGHGVSIKSSEDRVHWEEAGRVFAESELPDWHTKDIPEQEGHLWAPDIHYRDGTYHLYYSVSTWMNFNSSIGYATNTTLDPSEALFRRTR